MSFYKCNTKNGQVTIIVCKAKDLVKKLQKQQKNKGCRHKGQAV